MREKILEAIWLAGFISIGACYCILVGGVMLGLMPIQLAGPIIISTLSAALICMLILTGVMVVAMISDFIEDRRRPR